MNNKALDILKKYYGYNSFRKGQNEIIEEILNGKDVLSIMPTGGGKSICYQIPGVIFEGLTIVISPLISLMKDQVDSINNIGIKSAYINSSLSNMEIEEIYTEIKCNNIKILYLAPERLKDSSFLNLISNINVSQIAIDEAHCVSAWGHDFRSSYKYISNFINLFKERPVVTAFTATATKEVREDILNLLELKNPQIFISGFDRENLEIIIEKGVRKKKYILGYISKNKNSSGIIYCSTRKEVENIYELLIKNNIDARRYHAGLSDNERKESQEDFVYDRVKIMVATNAFGMGIDKPNIRFIIHNNMPRTIENYYQEIGRAGRDGEEAECILLFSPGDVQTQKYIIDTGTLNPFRKRNELEKLQKIIDLIYSNDCYRKYILNYFGEKEEKENCGKCSSCNFKGEVKDKTIDAQKVISCVYRMKRPYGIGMVIDVLRGSKNKKLIQFGFNELSTYGIMKDYSKEDLKDFINTLVSNGYLNYDGEYPTLSPNSNSVKIIKGEEKVLFKEERKIKVVEVDNDLLILLKDLRSQIGIEEKIPPYMVFGDNTLKEMSFRFPTKSDELLDISGVGEKKLNSYGEKFLNLIKDYLVKNNIESKFNFKEDYNLNLKDKINEDSKKKSFEITMDIIKSGRSLEETIKLRKITISTAITHIKTYLENGNEIDFKIDFKNLFSEDEENEILEVLKEIGCNRLKPIKENVRESISYDTIRLVILKKFLEEKE